MSTAKNKLLVIIVGILLLTNIALIAFIVFNKAPEKRGRGDREAMMTEFLQKQVGFNEQQMQQYDTLSKQHKENMRMRFDEMRNNRQQVYKAVGDQSFNDSAINDAATKLSASQKDMEANMLRHFASIRKICTPEQQPKFDSMLYKIWNKMGDRKKKPE
jgi:periplasmic protein CpxP/Spy